MVGEVEHDGDIALTIEQIKSMGGKNVQCVEASFENESGLFSFDHEVTDRYEMSCKLNAAEVCL